MGHSSHFSNAIVRLPGKSIAGGLRAHNVGDPDPARFVDQHGHYVQALEEAGVHVDILPAWEQFPDSVFIEDSALCLPAGAVILRPGATTRTGESAVMADVLSSYFGDVRSVGEDGFIEGGDIMVTESEIIVGLSERTDAAGAKALQDCLNDWGLAVRILQTQPGVLHFKTACGLVDDETIVATKSMAAAGFFNTYKTLVLPEGEEAAANAIAVNGKVLIPEGFPKTAELITRAGYSVVQVAISEAAKVDGGLSCMSLRFTPTL
ncbi:MAG: dimethylarginine dimethylaminohydrolase [Rhodospirillaceae bacterium]|nr:dimethylarginine dimethylaminohydrolase [Rhodospirillaceae bacterium]MBL6930388.1 dimethylarginine dimethylaminohydrolase [Rhodospirillales bacterium]